MEIIQHFLAQRDQIYMHIGMNGSLNFVNLDGVATYCPSHTHYNQKIIKISSLKCCCFTISMDRKLCSHVTYNILLSLSGLLMKT